MYAQNYFTRNLTKNVKYMQKGKQGLLLKLGV